MATLRKRIGCSKFLTLIKRSIKAGYMDKKKFYESNKGLFQGNVTSPILNNIYLHEFDVFMMSLRDSFHTGNSRRKNPEFRRISYAISKAKTFQEKRFLRKQLWKVDSKEEWQPASHRYRAHREDIPCNRPLPTELQIFR